MNGESSERASKRIKVEDSSSSISNGRVNGFEHEQQEAVAGSSKAAKLEGADEEDVKQVLKQEEEAQNEQAEEEEVDDNYGIYEEYAQEAAGAVPPSGDLYLDTVSLQLLGIPWDKLIHVRLRRSIAQYWTLTLNACAPSACRISTSTRASSAASTTKDEARARMRTPILYTTITMSLSTSRLSRCAISSEL
jgi:hypothetical protein